MSGTSVQPQLSRRRGSGRGTDVWQALAVGGFLVVSVLLVYSRTLGQGFLDWDDSSFVYNEPNVSGGLSWSGVVWAFTNGPFGEWYPLSMLSHMVDGQLYGLRPTGHHLTNVLLHAAAAVALFLVLWRMTAGLWPSALVAALFALHPLHVESVAWVAERRDVLSGLFFMLTLGAYGEYVRHPRSLGRYLAVVGLFAFGLMAKAILVTLPAVLLLLDFWPLGRFDRTQSNTAAPGERRETAGGQGWFATFPWRVVVDKLPLFALSIAAAAVTMLTHSPHPDPFTFSERLSNAAVSCVAYLAQLFVPVGLSPFYAYPEGGWPAWQVAAACALLLVITAAAVIGRRCYPYVFVGWFWYVGMLVPVLRLTLGEPDCRADRYTYLSQIGLYIALVWGATRLGAAWPARRWVFGVGSALVLTALLACTWQQTGYWQNDQTLWDHALACDPTNPTAHYILGSALEKTDEAGAAAQYRQTLEMGPNQRRIYYLVGAQAHNGLGNIAERRGDRADAIAHFEQALDWYSGYAPAHTNLGVLLAKSGDLDQAKAHFQRSIELSPREAPATYFKLGVALYEQKQTDDAIASFRKAIEADPQSSLAHTYLGTLLAQQNEIDEAMVHFGRSIELNPDVAFPYYQIAQLLSAQGKTDEAARYHQRGISASLRYAETQNLRGVELADQGKLKEAIAQFRTAISVNPNYAQAHGNLADALALQDESDEAIAHYRQALAIDSNLATARQGLQKLLNRPKATTSPPGHEETKTP